MSENSNQVVQIVKSTLQDIIKRQFRYPRVLLFSLLMVLIFALSVFIVKPNLVLTFEDVEERESEGEEDWGEDLGPVTIFFLIGFVLPFILWSYFREVIQFFIFKFLLTNQTNNDEEIHKTLTKRTRELYFQIRKWLINIHSIGGISGCFAIILHMSGLFPYHDGMSFFFAWTAMLIGIYLASTGIMLRIRFKNRLLFTKTTSKIGRMIHLQIILAIIGLLSIILHLNFN